MTKTTLVSSLLLCIAATASAGVVPGDTYDISVEGFTSTGAGAYLVAPIDAVFGTSTTYAGGEFNGAAVTVSSSETIGATITTDTFTISVPVNFAPAGTTLNRRPVTQLQVDLGGYNAGLDTVDFTGAIDAASLSVTANSVYSGGNFPLAPNFELSNGDLSLAAVAGVSSNPSSIEPYDFHKFSFTVSYDNIPVASVSDASSSLVLLGLSGLALVAARRLLS